MKWSDVDMRQLGLVVETESMGKWITPGEYRVFALPRDNTWWNFDRYGNYMAFDSESCRTCAIPLEREVVIIDD